MDRTDLLLLALAHARRFAAATATDPWAHLPSVCGTLECPGCWAESYVPRTNGDRAEDVESGHPMRHNRPSDGEWD